jgi:hypothetical protein
MTSSIPAVAEYEVYISQLIRYSRACDQYIYYLDRDQLLTQKRQGYLFNDISHLCLMS